MADRDLIERLHQRMNYLMRRFKELSPDRMRGEKQGEVFDEKLILRSAFDALTVGDRDAAELFLREFKVRARNGTNPPLAQEAVAELALKGIPEGAKDEWRYRSIVLEATRPRIYGDQFCEGSETSIAQASRT